MADLATQLHALYKRFGHLKGISIECQKELIAIGIHNKAASAEIFLQGAQLSAYKRKGERPILFLSQACEYKQGSPLRGGIPICWPWFGDLDKNPGSVKNQYSDDFIANAPAHGLVRQKQWTLEEIEIKSEVETCLWLGLDVPPSDDWPFKAHLEYKITVGESLSISLDIQNIGARAFNMSTALHSYFSLQNIAHTSVGGLDQCSYIDALKNWELKKQMGDIEIDQEVDRIYLFSEAQKHIQLNDLHRVIHLHSQGSRSVVVWNPWVDKAKRLSQFQDDEYKNMLCIETANALDDAVEVQPNGRHKLELTIS